MGLGDVSGSVVPLADHPAPHGGTITSRYFMNAQRCHKGHAVTGALASRPPAACPAASRTTSPLPALRHW